MCSGSTRFGLRLLNASWIGPVRFGSVRFRVLFRPVPELIGSVRFGLAGSVQLLIPSCECYVQQASDVDVLNLNQETAVQRLATHVGVNSDQLVRRRIDATAYDTWSYDT